MRVIYCNARNIRAVGFGNRQYECGAAAVIHPSEVFLAWHSAFLFRREKIPGASF